MITVVRITCLFMLLLQGFSSAALAAEEPADIVALDVTADVPALEAAEAEATIEVVEALVDLDSLLLQLTDVSLKEALDLLPQLEEVGGLPMLPLFETMLAGELYYEEDTLQLLKITEGSDGLDIITDVFGAELLVEIDEDNTKKIRVNNRLRTALRETIARINLTEGSAKQRRSAAAAMLSSMDETGVELFREAMSNEADEDVLELMRVGIAMFNIVNSTDEQGKLDAIAILDGRLETPVRNLLASFLPEGANAENSLAVRRAAEAALNNIDDDVEFYLLIEQIFFGLSLGSVLLLAAIGLAVTFGVMGVINMAHGEMLMLGAYTTYVVQLLMPNAINYSIWVAVPAAFVVAGLVGILIQRYVIRYLHGRPLETLLATFGISLILQQTVRTIFSPLNRRVVSPDWMSGSLELNPVLSLTYNRMYILIFALIVFVALVAILKKTSLGLNVRAVSQNRAMAKSMGVRTDYVDAMTFGLGSGIAGMAGVALSQLTNVGPNLGQSYIIDSFMVVVFGGVGNLLGTLLAAFSLGVGNKFLEPVTGAVLANIFILVFIILFIQKRPKGLFPQKGRAAE